MRTKQEEREYHRGWKAKNLKRAKEIANHCMRRKRLCLAMQRVVQKCQSRARYPLGDE